MPKITDHTYTCTHCLFADLMQGCPHTEAFSSLPPSLRGRGEDEEEEEVAEQNSAHRSVIHIVYN